MAWCAARIFLMVGLLWPAGPLFHVAWAQIPCPLDAPMEAAVGVSCWDEVSIRSQARVEEFFVLIDARQPEEALKLMGDNLVGTDANRAAWLEQFRAIASINILDLEPTSIEDWTETRHVFRASLEAYVGSGPANNPIPYYGWHDNPNLRWIVVELGPHKSWLISSIAIGP